MEPDGRQRAPYPVGEARGPEGLGVIGKNQTGVQTRGLRMHSMFVVDGEGLPLGTLGCQCEAVEPKSSDGDKKAGIRPLEERKTFRWIKWQRELEEIKRLLPSARLVNVMDREGDCFEIFDDQRSNCPNVDLLVRAHHNRGTAEGTKLLEALDKAGVAARLDISVPRQSARKKKRGQKARTGRKARVARVALSYREICLNPPSNLKGSLKPIRLWALRVVEENPPDGQEPVDWRLLTTIPIVSVKDAIQCVKW